jgi:Oxidoreductase molybdopterin binding domain/Sodium/hydrogen exchanger family
VVLEIVAGIVLGPSVLGWVELELPLEVLSGIGLAFLLFLAGLEGENFQRNLRIADQVEAIAAEVGATPAQVALAWLLAKVASWGLAQYAYGGKPLEPFYEVIDPILARHQQTILAYEFNDAPLPLRHGAPLRLRVETQLGYKMVKYLRSIELIEDYRIVGEGRGGSREDA